MITMDTILTVLLIWFAVSIVASLLIGRFLGVMSQRQMMRKPLTTPNRPVSDNGAYRAISFARTAQTIRNK